MANTIMRRMNEEYVQGLNAVMNERFMEGVEAAAAVIEKAFHDGNKVFSAGNGGSAATASHLIADFQKTTLGKDHDKLPKRIKAIALSDNIPLITAYGNDVSYDIIFAGQLESLADAGDVLVVITASGNSPNIVAVLESAKRMGVKTIGFLGFKGGKCKDLCDVVVLAESEDYGIIEDAHAIIMHMLTQYLKTIVRAPLG